MIRNIWAVGRNYAEHAKELGNDIPTAPLIFLKAGSCAVQHSSEFTVPDWCQDVHHEIELALRFDDKLNITQAAVALDLTERKKQNELKTKGQPWTLAKSFTNSCPLSDFFEVKNVTDLSDLTLLLHVNGDLRQKGSTQQMIFNIPTLVDYVRQHFPVCPGDILLTGTPSGVAAIQKGDQIQAEIVGKIKHHWTVR